jgi:FkbM family methyltransferase
MFPSGGGRARFQRVVGCYPMTSRYDPSLVFDLGAHRGELTQLALAKGFQKVVAVEAHPRLAEGLAKRFMSHEGVTVLNNVIGPEADSVPFYLSGSPLGQTSSVYHERVKAPEQAAYEVLCISYPMLAAVYGVPYYMKADLEGADVDLLRQMLEWSPACDRPPYLSVELSAGHHADTLEIFATLDRMGYAGFSLAEQAHGVPTWFGGPQELRHYWVTLEEVVAQWFSPVNVPCDGVWFDLHAMHRDAPVKVVTNDNP